MKIKQILLGLGFALVLCAFANAQAANADSQDGSTEGQSSSQFQVTTITAADMPALRSMWESSLKHVNDAIAINMQAVIDLQQSRSTKRSAVLWQCALIVGLFRIRHSK